MTRGLPAPPPPCGTPMACSVRALGLLLCSHARSGPQFRGTRPWCLRHASRDRLERSAIDREVYTQRACFLGLFSIECGFGRRGLVCEMFQ